MPLLNYTTSIAASKTVAEIHRVLVGGKARAIATEYDEDGRPVGLGFEVNTPFGFRAFSLPVNAEAVFVVLKRQKVTPKLRTAEQANRVAWRILKDWVEAQLAIVATEMVTLDQVMLPYLRTDDGRTIYESYTQQQLMIDSGRSSGVDSR